MKPENADMVSDNKAFSRSHGQSRPEPKCTARDHVDVRELVGSRRQVTISHAGEDYTLRITRNGKLILTK
jgi:hemin uptake protein HemP